jgi:hypothetical protein
VLSISRMLQHHLHTLLLSAHLVDLPSCTEVGLQVMLGVMVPDCAQKQTAYMLSLALFAAPCTMHTK